MFAGNFRLKAKKWLLGAMIVLSVGGISSYYSVLTAGTSVAVTVILYRMFKIISRIMEDTPPALESLVTSGKGSLAYLEEPRQLLIH